ncbi:MAG: alpha-E domain-containing protein [Burkholderiaceae bacterium]
MLSRTADHLFWMSRYMERAAQARSACDAVTTRPRATARAVVSARWETKHAV